MSVKTHKRADTYEGPQMNFKFPSDEDLQNTKVESVELTGPKVEPYYRRGQPSPILEESIASQGSQDELMTHRVDDSVNFASGYSDYTYGPKNHKSQGQESNFSSAFASNESSNYMTVSIPTQDNVTYIITNPSSLKSSPSVYRKTSMKSNNSSLYRKASLKRSKAVKYKVGWLTRLKQMGVNIKKKLRKWRFISVRKAFKTTGKRFKKGSLKKKNISMPLERERAKSISELKREINDWYVPQKPDIPVGSFENLPKPDYRVVSGASTTSSKRVPPPLPPHRIASTPMLKQHNQQAQDSHSILHDQTLNRSFSTPMGTNILQSQPKIQPTLLQPHNESYHPYQQLAASDDESNPHISSKVIYDEDIDTEFEEDYYHVKDNEDLIRDLWRGYLRRTIAARIESKLEVFRIAQIPEPVQQQEYAEEVFGIISDYDSEETLSDFDGADDESLTSISGSEFSTSDDMSSQIMSEASTNYFSTYSNNTPVPPVQLSRESYNFLQAQLQNVKRSSTLPTHPERISGYRPVEAHNRFLSVVN